MPVTFPQSPPSQLLKAAPPTELVRRVKPTGIYRRDVAAIKAALAGAVPANHRTLRIVLEATNAAGEPQYFNLGDGRTGEPRATIEVACSVTIVGETMPGAYHTTFAAAHPQAPQVGLDRTVIYGGYKVFSCRTQGVILSVANLYFAYPEWSAVQVSRADGVEVSGCVVYGVTLGTTTFATGTQLTGAFGFEITSKSTQPSDLQGPLHVHDNLLYRDPADINQLGSADDDVGSGIAVQKTHMVLDIHDNTISNFSWAGIGIMGNERDVTVARNAVACCGYRYSRNQTKPSAAYCGGIGVLATNATGFSALIDSNTIICGPPANTTATLVPRYGIVLRECQGVTVTGNGVTGMVSVAGIGDVAPTGVNAADPANNTVNVTVV